MKLYERCSLYVVFNYVKYSIRLDRYVIYCAVAIGNFYKLRVYS